MMDFEVTEDRQIMEKTAASIVGFIAFIALLGAIYCVFVLTSS